MSKHSLSEDEVFEIAAAMYGDGEVLGWLRTVDGTPNSAVYELVGRIEGIVNRVIDNRLATSDFLLDAAKHNAKKDNEYLIEKAAVIADAHAAEQEKIRKIVAVTDDLKKHNGYGGSSCGVCSGHSPEWDGHSRNCKKAYPKRIREILNGD